MIRALRHTRLGRYASRLSPAAFAWAFAGYLGLWFIGGIIVTMCSCILARHDKRRFIGEALTSAREGGLGLRAAVETMLAHHQHASNSAVEYVRQRCDGLRLTGSLVRIQPSPQHWGLSWTHR